MTDTNKRPALDHLSLQSPFKRPKPEGDTPTTTVPSLTTLLILALARQYHHCLDDDERIRLLSSTDLLANPTLLVQLINTVALYKELPLLNMLQQQLFCEEFVLYDYVTQLQEIATTIDSLTPFLVDPTAAVVRTVGNTLFELESKRNGLRNYLERTVESIEQYRGKKRDIESILSHTPSLTDTMKLKYNIGALES